MKISVFPMEQYGESPEGKAVLRAAYVNNASNITQRIAPITSGQDAEGEFMVLLLDWPNGMIIRIIFSKDEALALKAGLQAITDIDLLDTFDEKGATIH